MNGTALLITYPVGAELAREEAGTFNISIDSYAAFASKLGSYKGSALIEVPAFKPPAHPTAPPASPDTRPDPEQ